MANCSAIQGQPPTGARTTSKWMDNALGPEMMGRMQDNGQSSLHYSEWNGMKKSEGISKGFFTDAGSLAMRTSEKVMFRTQILLAFVCNKGFCELLSVGSEFKEYMEEVLPFCADGKISQDLVKGLKKILLSFTHWSRYYEDANATLETTNAELSKFHQLQKQVEALRNGSKQAGNDEKEGDKLLEHLQRRKSAMEALKDEGANLSFGRQTRDGKNRTRLDELKKVETEKDNLEIQLPRINGEHARALLTKKYIEDQWSELVRGFNVTFNV